MKSENKSRIILIIFICIIWRYLLGNSIEFGVKDQYIFPTLGSAFFMVILGELTRKLFRAIVPKKKKKGRKYIIHNYQENESKKDIEALNFGILWAFLWMISTII